MLQFSTLATISCTTTHVVLAISQTTGAGFLAAAEHGTQVIPEQDDQDTACFHSRCATARLEVFGIGGGSFRPLRRTVRLERQESALCRPAEPTTFGARLQLGHSAVNRYQ